MTNWLTVLSILLHSRRAFSVVLQFDLAGKTQISDTESPINGSPFKWITQTVTTPDVTARWGDYDSNCFDIEADKLGFDSASDPVVSRVTYLTAPRNRDDPIGLLRNFQIELFESFDCSLDDKNVNDIPVIIQLTRPSSASGRKTMGIDLSNVSTGIRKEGSTNILVPKPDFKPTDLRRPQRSFKFMSRDQYVDAWNKQISKLAVFVYPEEDGVNIFGLAPREYQLLNLNEVFEQDE